MQYFAALSCKFVEEIVAKRSFSDKDYFLASFGALSAGTALGKYFRSIDVFEEFEEFLDNKIRIEFYNFNVDLR